MSNLGEGVREYGIKIGIEQGMKQGMEQGRVEIISEIVRNMSGQECSPEQISTLTGVNLETVRDIISDVNAKSM